MGHSENFQFTYFPHPKTWIVISTQHIQYNLASFGGTVHKSIVDRMSQYVTLRQVV
jgi:hypothetical protein